MTVNTTTLCQTVHICVVSFYNSWFKWPLTSSRSLKRQEVTSSSYLVHRWLGTSVRIVICCRTQRGTARGRARARCELVGGVEGRRGGRKENGPGSPGRPERCRSPTPLNSPLPRCRWASHQWSRTNPETQTTHPLLSFEETELCFGFLNNF